MKSLESLEVDTGRKVCMRAVRDAQGEEVGRGDAART